MTLLSWSQVRDLLRTGQVEGTWSNGVKAIRLSGELSGAVFAWKRANGWVVDYSHLRSDAPFRRRIDAVLTGV